MDERVLAVCVLVVVIGGLATVSAATDESGVGALQVEDGRTGVAAPGADLGTAAYGDADSLRSELAVASLETRLDRAESDDQRQAAVRSAADRLEMRLATSRSERRAAGEEFENGSRSADSFALALARVDGDARRHLAERRAIRSAVDERPTVSLSNGLESTISERSGIDGEALALQGENRQRLRRAAVTGDRQPVVLTVSDHGVATRAVTDETYYRDVTRWDRQNPDGENVFRDADGGPVSAAYDRAKSEYYTTVYEMAITSGTNNPSILTYGGSIYRVTFPYDGGRVRAFIDGNTTDPFRELQRQSIETLDPQQRATHTGDGLEVAVNATAPGGPLSIEVTDDGPVDARVEMDNRTVGRTGPDGRLWTVDPGVETPVTIRASDNRTVAFEVEATAPTTTES
ncbi:MAG: DUF7094 domain-containing protein [Halococcoides sp.]